MDKNKYLDVFWLQFVNFLPTMSNTAVVIRGVDCYYDEAENLVVTWQVTSYKDQTIALSSQVHESCDFSAQT